MNDKRVEIGFSEPDSEQESNSIEVLLRQAGEYNNLNAKISARGSLSLEATKRLIKNLEEKGKAIDKEWLDLLERTRQFSNDLSEEMDNAGVSETEADHCLELHLHDGKTAVAGDEEFLREYLIKVGKVYQGMIRRGYTPNQIIA